MAWLISTLSACRIFCSCFFFKHKIPWYQHGSKTPQSPPRPGLSEPLRESLLFSGYLWEVVISSWEYLWFKYSFIHVLLPATTIYSLYILLLRNNIHTLCCLHACFPKTYDTNSLVHWVTRTRLGNGQLVRRQCTIDNQFDLSRCIIWHV